MDVNTPPDPLRFCPPLLFQTFTEAVPPIPSVPKHSHLLLKETPGRVVMQGRCPHT